MEKLEVVNKCDCLSLLLNSGYLSEFDVMEDSSNYYLGEIFNGQISMKMDIVVDNGWYDDYGNYISKFDIISSYYPIEYCPICGKKIEYDKTYKNSLKLV